MARAGLTVEGKAAAEALGEKVLDDWAASQAVQRSNPARARARTQAKVARAMNTVRGTDDIDNMLACELTLLKHDRQHYANTPIMVTSLDTAIKDCTQTIVMLDVIRDPVEYRKLDKIHQYASSRVGDLPKDDAESFSVGNGSAFKVWEKQLARMKIKKC